MSPDEIAAFEREQQAKVRRPTSGTALSEIDGGVWATDETADTSELREKLGATDRVIASEPRGYSIDASGRIVTGDNVVV